MVGTRQVGVTRLEPGPPAPAMQALLLLAMLAADDRVQLCIESDPVGATVMVGTPEVGVTPLEPGPSAPR